MRIGWIGVIHSEEGKTIAGEFITRELKQILVGTEFVLTSGGHSQNVEFATNETLGGNVFVRHLQGDQLGRTHEPQD